LGVPTSEVGYTSATTGRGDHEVHKGHVVALDKKINKNTKIYILMYLQVLPKFEFAGCRLWTA
jgi:hypothetical protein